MESLKAAAQRLAEEAAKDILDSFFEDPTAQDVEIIQSAILPFLSWRQ